MAKISKAAIAAIAASAVQSYSGEPLYETVQVLDSKTEFDEDDIVTNDRGDSVRITMPDGRVAYATIGKGVKPGARSKLVLQRATKEDPTNNVFLGKERLAFVL